jgi:hypothetical protein
MNQIWTVAGYLFAHKPPDDDRLPSFFPAYGED